ncbi:MAG: hypothetical protein RIR98_1724, partial [Bacteroidota bacterium]
IRNYKKEHVFFHGEIDDVYAKKVLGVEFPNECMGCDDVPNDISQTRW